MLSLFAVSTTGFHAPATRIPAHTRTTAVEMAIPASVKVAGVVVPAAGVAVWAGECRKAHTAAFIDLPWHP